MKIIIKNSQFQQYLLSLIIGNFQVQYRYNGIIIVVFIKTWKNAPENNTQDSPHNQAYDLPGLHMMMTRDAFNTG